MIVKFSSNSFVAVALTAGLLSGATSARGAITGQ